MVPAGPVLRCAEAVGECLPWGDGALRYPWHAVEGVCVALPDAVPVDGSSILLLHRTARDVGGYSPVMLEAVGDVDNEFVAPVRFDQGTRESPVHGKDLSLEAIGGECRIRRD